MDPLKQIRIELCQALDHCQQCLYLKEYRDGNQLLNVCRTQCRHWENMQRIRERIECLQKKKRTHHLLFKEKQEEPKKTSERDPLTCSIGMKLSLIRTERNLSQYQVAKRLGLDHSTVSKYEKGQRKPTRQILERYAQFYQIPITEIVGMNG